MNAPGWIPPYDETAPGDDCMRMAFSCVTGIHPRRLRYLRPDDYPTGQAFWRDWRALAREKGFRLVRAFNSEGAPLRGRHGGGNVAPGGPWPFADDELWIAGVPSFHHYDGLHAVVMLGQQLHYDPSDLPRSRRPTRIESGWRVKPNAR